MDDRDYSADIARALATPGGHLSIGRGGWTLHYLNEYGGESRLSWYVTDRIKLQAIAASLPVIDSRPFDFDKPVKLSVFGPMIAVGREPDPQPWHALSFAPLSEVARAYAAAGADVHNLCLDGAAGAAG
jgi:hypothetical protein